ncbi:MAG: metallophosphoesterase [Candidatus Bipolaricaulota bacterium]|nr:metallophosphoesterase [Candidatus Bipolaricaulota bacterium]
MRRLARRAVVVALVMVGVGGSALFAAGVGGVVFLDKNHNGALDSGETGVSGAVVSDGLNVVRTDDAGRFSLPDNNGARFVFLSTPNGMKPSAGWYRAVAEGGSYVFPLETRDESGPLVFAQLSDIHYAPDPEALSRAFADREMAFLPNGTLDGLVAEINPLAPDFVILTGDIIANAKGPELDEVKSWFTTMDDGFVSRFTVPVYEAMGNHDEVRDPAVDKAVYEEHFGPTYYSFNVKGTHCVVLDLHQLQGTSQIYSLSAAELDWLRRDLALVGANAPILVFCHEPTPDWAQTPENAALWDLLVGSNITALLNGHWHTNYVLREEPFYELTSGAVCGSWWEGPNPDGTGFGYRIYEMPRGRLESTWRTVGANVVSFTSPAAAALTWTDRLVASVWGEAASAAYCWDGGANVTIDVASNGLWSTAAGNLNVATLPSGYHTLTITFSMTSGGPIVGRQAFYILVPGLSLSDFIDHPEVFQGKMVGTTALEVRAVMGADISATDGTKTIIVAKFPLSVAKGDRVSVVGMYRATSADPIKAFDLIFSVKLAK